jgi:DNA-binding MarR family transcriptional regulator
MGKLPNSAGDGAEPTFEQLVRLLKMASFVNSPMKDGVCDPSGINQIELKVMMALAGEGELAGHDLVEIMGVPAMNVSRALGALREKGWIEDAVDPDNRRRKPVRLRQAGKAEYERLHPAVEAVALALLGGLSPAQQRQFAAISEKIIAAMTQWIRDHHEGVKV